MSSAKKRKRETRDIYDTFKQKEAVSLGAVENLKSFDPNLLPVGCKATLTITSAARRRDLLNDIKSWFPGIKDQLSGETKSENRPIKLTWPNGEVLGFIQLEDPEMRIPVTKKKRKSTKEVAFFRQIAFSLLSLSSSPPASPVALLDLLEPTEPIDAELVLPSPKRRKHGELDVPIEIVAPALVDLPPLGPASVAAHLHGDSMEVDQPVYSTAPELYAPAVPDASLEPTSADPALLASGLYFDLTSPLEDMSSPSTYSADSPTEDFDIYAENVLLQSPSDSSSSDSDFGLF